MEEFELKVTGNHKIKVGNVFKKAAYIKVGTMLSDICVVESKRRIRKKLKVYDILDIKDTNSFLSKNGICLHNCEEGFLASVMPVVSSSKTSQIIIVSTPHGMNNEYYRIWNRAQLDLDSDGDGLKWTPVRIDWYDVPGRDEKWKQEQLITFNNDMAKFSQEYPVWLAIGGADSDGKPTDTVYISYDNGVTWSLGDDLLQLPEYINPFSKAQAFVYNSTMEETRALHTGWKQMPSRHLPFWWTIAGVNSGTRATTAVTSWKCPYIYMFGGVNANGVLMNNIWKGVINRLSFKPVV